MTEALVVPRALALIPVYDHASTLRRVVEATLAVGLPVLVVDDGSRDHPLDQVADLPCRTLSLSSNQGKGAALLAGARTARDLGFEAVVTLDADGQHDARDAVGLLEAAQAHWPALVLGVRCMEGAQVPGSSRFGRAFSNFWVRLECGRDLGDTQSGFRVYPVEALLDLPCRSRRYAFEVEILVRAAWRGLPIVEAPVSVAYGPERITHFRAWTDNLRFTALHAWLCGLALVRRLPGAGIRA